MSRDRSRRFVRLVAIAPLLIASLAYVAAWTWPSVIDASPATLVFVSGGTVTIDYRCAMLSVRPTPLVTLPGLSIGTYLPSGTARWSLRLNLLGPAALAAVPLPFVFRPRQQHRAGRCHGCGYDLRASPERCPECGRTPVVEAMG